MENEMASFYSTTNGIPSATNGQCVVVNETKDTILADQEQAKNTEPISLRSPVIEEADEADDSTRDIADTRTVRKKRTMHRSADSYSEINLRPSKLVLIVGICCVTGLALPPIILYFIPIDTNSHDDVYTSNNFSVVNLSSVSIMFAYISDSIATYLWIISRVAT